MPRPTASDRVGLMLVPSSGDGDSDVEAFDGSTLSTKWSSRPHWSATNARWHDRFLALLMRPVTLLVLLTLMSVACMYVASNLNDARAENALLRARLIQATADDPLVLTAAEQPSAGEDAIPTPATAACIAAPDAFSPPPGLALVPLPKRTLVIYVFSNSDPNYYGNLEYFITHAVRAHQNIDYVFIINQHPLKEGEQAYDPTSEEEWHAGLIEQRHFPTLPPNAQYVEHINECLDLGTVNWYLDTAEYARAVRENNQTRLAQPAPVHWSAEKYGNITTDVRDYHYFFTINSSVRGPMFPAYFDFESRTQYWTYPFTKMMEDHPEIKYVGCTASCQYTPHVQSYVLALDQTSLALLRDYAWRCSPSLGNAVWVNELGGAFAILSAGYNLGALLPSMYLREFRSSDPKKFVPATCTELAWGQDPARDPSHNYYDLIFHKHQRTRPSPNGADERIAIEKEWNERREHLEHAREEGTFGPLSYSSQMYWVDRMRGHTGVNQWVPASVHPNRYSPLEKAEYEADRTVARVAELDAKKVDAERGVQEAQHALASEAQSAKVPSPSAANDETPETPAAKQLRERRDQLTKIETELADANKAAKEAAKRLRLIRQPNAQPPQQQKQQP